MRTIPCAVQSILKLRKMIGTYKPNYEVTVEGLSGDRTFPESWQNVIQGTGTTAKNISNWVEKTSGGYMCCWFDATTLKLQTGHSTDLGFLTTNYAIESVTVTDAITVLAAESNQVALYRLDSGKVLAIYANATAESWCKCAISNSGNGDDWAYLSTIRATQTGTDGGGCTVTVPLILPSGRIIFSMALTNNRYGGYLFTGAYICYTDNVGASWTIVDRSRSLAYGMDNLYQMCRLADGTLWYAEMCGSSECEWSKSTDDGDTWSYVADFKALGWGTSLYYDEAADTAYALTLGSGLYKYEHPTTAGFVTAGNWVQIYGGWVNSYATPIIYIIGGYLTLYNPYNQCIHGIPGTSIVLPVKSISISRNKNMAAQLDLTLDNKGGEWAPDGTAHPHALWPNKTVTVKQGYGTELITTFTGLIDTIVVSSFPHEISVSCRDYMKYALDQKITSGDVHVLTYTNQTIEAIVADLAGKCGLSTGNIQATGVTLTEKTFQWCSYADCFSELASLVGYEYGCTETGTFYFRRDTVQQPSATDWELTISGGAGLTLFYPIVQYSETIKSSDGLTTYARDTDYTIDYETGDVASITITDGSYLMSYIYAAYTFAEGTEITSLRYTIDDEAAHTKVAIYGDDDGAVVFGSADYASKDYYNVLPQKFLKLDAPECDTSDMCASLAQDTVDLMESKIRTCEIGTVAVPWLQDGDIVKITEKSSTISELYRITDIRTIQTESQYTANMTCYHHSYA